MCSVKIQSAWHCATINGLEKALILREDSGEDVDPTNLMSTETCVFLTKEGEDGAGSVKDSCTITLQTTGNTVISSLSILSEARLVEVYGSCEEYLKTVRAEFLLEVEDTTVYCAYIKLDHPCNYLLLKFYGQSRENDIWLYGISVSWKVSLSKSSSNLAPGMQPSPFNSEALDRRLSDLGQDLSANAQQYKKVMELCNLKSKGDTGNIQAMKPSISDFVASMFRGLPTREREASLNNKTHFEVLLDQKLTELEHNILAEVDKRMKKMEERQQTLITDCFQKMMEQLKLGFSLNEDKPSTSNLKL